MGVATPSLSAALLFGSLIAISAFTDPLDLAALHDMCEAMNCPQQLTGWKSYAGDPCGEELWKGVTCSGQFVTAIKIRGLTISGYLALPQKGFHFLKELDVSNNSIGGGIPNTLPKNATLIDLSYNQFRMNIPSSLPSLKSLGHLNLSHNLLSGPIGDVFIGLKNLKELDLSFNYFSGDLPSSFSSLTHLLRLHLQENQFTGSVFFLSDLPLNILNIENNCFSGIIPEQFHNITILKIGGNMFQPGFALAPYHGNDDAKHVHVPPGHKTFEKNISVDTTTISSTFGNSIQQFDNHNKNLVKRAIAATISSMAFLAMFATIHVIMHKWRSHQRRPKRLKENNNDSHSLPITLFNEDQGHSPQAICLSGKVPKLTPHRKLEKVSKRKGNPRRSRSLPIATLYSSLDLSIATDSFSEEYLIGEGSIGWVYRAEFPGGQMFAVKKIDLDAQTIKEEDKFLDVIASISHLKHPNILGLRGYCMEQGQHILVHDYCTNGSVDKILHSKNECQGTLTWKARITIVVCIAGALEMAHGNLHPRNILLDDALIPHISDCGLNALEPLVKRRANSSRFAAYNAPEYGQPGMDMTKSDIFSFGVVLLELLTGQRAFDRRRAPEEQSLVKWASSRPHDFALFEAFVDPAIKGTFPSRALSQFVDIISLCIQPQPEFRPPITEIADLLVSLIDSTSHGIRMVSTEGVTIDVPN